jgi:hypothetical protein
MMSGALKMVRAPRTYSGGMGRNITSEMDVYTLKCEPVRNSTSGQ